MLHIFSAKNISIYAIFDVQSFNDTLTNDIIIFEQLGPAQNHMLWALLMKTHNTYFHGEKYPYSLVEEKKKSVLSESMNYSLILQNVT